MRISTNGVFSFIEVAASQTFLVCDWRVVRNVRVMPGINGSFYGRAVGYALRFEQKERTIMPVLASNGRFV